MAGSLTTVEDLRVALAKTSQLSSLVVPFLPRLLATATKAYADSALPSRLVGHPLKSRAPAQPPHVIPDDAELDSPQTQQLIQANKQARFEHEAREDQLHLQRLKYREYIRTRRGQHADPQSFADVVSTASCNPYSHLLPDSIQAPASSVPADIYDPRSIPPDLRSTLPPLGRGRPSKIVQARRRAIIYSYWVARGYKGE